jgi:hypothetical protein
MDLRAVVRDDPDAHQPGLRAQRQDTAKQLADRRLVTLAKPRDRAMVRPTVGCDHPERDVLDALALDHTRRALPTRIRVQQQRDHHRRVMRRTTVGVLTVRAIKRRQIELLDCQDAPKIVG